MPTELDDRVELWRRELARRRAVVVLDNAVCSEQLLPPLPVDRGCVVLVTTRARLFAAELGAPESLGVLPPAEAVRLLAVTAGVDRVTAEPDAAGEVAQRCGYLPLAIRLAGARLAHRPRWRVVDLARRLANGPGGISQLAVENRTLAGAFAASYEPLSERSRYLFRMLAIHPGDDFSPPMASALADLPLSETARLLDDLVDRHLLEETSSGRYRLHDLMREYASELSRRLDDRQVRLHALDRLLDLCLRAALAVAVLLEPALDGKVLAVDPPPRPELLVALGAPDVEWLERERANLVALVAYAEKAGRGGYAWRLARALWRFCYIRSYFDDILTTNQHGLVAAERIGDRAAVAQMHNYLASAYVRTGNYLEATKLVKAAVAACQELGDRRNAARFRANLSGVYFLSGELDAALHLYLARMNGDQFHLLNALGHIGIVKTRLGHHASAIRLMNASLKLRDRTGHRLGEPELRVDLGISLRELRQLDEARRQHETALQLAIDNGERHAQCAALNELGVTAEAQGDPDEATRFHQRALELATRINHLQEQGRALARIGDLMMVEEPEQARRHWRRALSIFERTGAPEQHDLRRRLPDAAC
ncbi:tetratricopeptide repeat protein [Micromonospora sp. NPDC048999]|uniref:tetratricopeptide repeat protein n=1 Tax=Micromonospora sp. NPDC048999 TaxID=3155391 RepID=UPI0033EC62A6